MRNAVEHDARVLRAARVAERTLAGGACIVGVATDAAAAGETTVDGVRVLRLSARARRASSARARVSSAPVSARASTPHLGLRARAGRMLSGIAFTWQAIGVARRWRPVLVHANDWNTMWCALAIKLTCGARVIYDSHELWADRNGRWEQRWWLVASEALFVRMADEVITASPGYAHVLARRYRIRRPQVIRNIPEREGREGGLSHGDHFGRGASHNGSGASHNRHVGLAFAGASAGSREPLVVYVGGLMPGRGLEQTIDALALTGGVRLRAVGPGSRSYRAGLLERAAGAGVGDRLELAAAVPPRSVSGVLGEAAAGLCLIQPVCRSYELTLPNKLFEYAAAGVPVLASDMPVIAAVVRENELGEVVAPDDPGAIAAGLERLLQPNRRRWVAARAGAFAQANDWRGESAALASVYRRAVSG